jgi:hypothetical protein
LSQRKENELFTIWPGLSQLTEQALTEGLSHAQCGGDAFGPILRRSRDLGAEDQDALPHLQRAHETVPKNIVHD